jgi:outer membrane protein assembly factor BamB
MRLVVRFVLFVVVSNVIACAAPTEAPYQAGSPWPKFRAGLRQDGRSPVRPSTASGGLFWRFPTGKGIFSSPVVGADGTVYVGSADRWFYAIRPDGTLRWKEQTGEIIDSAALLDDRGRVYFGSGDGKLRAREAATGRELWTTAADDPTETGALINWFEGNVALSPSGTLWAGNDNFRLYEFDRDTGAIRQRIDVADQIWSSPAFDPRTGRLFVGNNNVVEWKGSNVISHDADGVPAWDRFVGVGTVAASPLVTPSGDVVVGSFDGFVRAFDGATGALRWERSARDHLYASPAQLPDGTIVQAGADGTVYALDPTTGAERWTFSIRDPIRSSPAVDGEGNIYFGGGDGRLWVLRADGTLRWSVQLIDDDRNDLNASPALGRDAVYIAGESGDVFSVPYDYCLRENHAAEPRCAPPPAATALPDDGAALLYVTPFGSELPSPPATIAPNQPLTFSLVARRGGRDELASIDGADVRVTFDPPCDARAEVSGDGRFLVVVPSSALRAGPDGKVALAIDVGVLGSLERVGLRRMGGVPSGRATLTARFGLAAPPAAAPLAPSTTWEVSRLALPIPTLMPSYNQIGFDSLHYLVGTVELDDDRRRGVALMIGALLDERGAVVPDPATRAVVPLEVSVSDDGGFVTFTNEAGLTVEVMNATIPLNSFRVAGRLDGGAAQVSGNTICAGVALYGPFLQQMGLCNAKSDLLSVAGAVLLARRDGGAPPSGVGAVTVALGDQAVTATLDGSTLRADAHVATLLLVDEATGRPVTLDYARGTRRTATASGALASVAVPLPAGGRASLPAAVRAILVVDTAPVSTTRLATR